MICYLLDLFLFDKKRHFVAIKGITIYGNDKNNKNYLHNMTLTLEIDLMSFSI